MWLAGWFPFFSDGCQFDFMSRLIEFEKAVADAMLADQFQLRRMIRGLKASEKDGRLNEKQLEKFSRQLQQSWIVARLVPLPCRN